MTRRWPSWVLAAASVVAVAAFGWPLVASAVPSDAQTAVPVVALAIVPALVVAIALTLDREMFTATTVALLGVLAAVGAAIRIAGTGVGGIEAVFILLILAGRVYGARFGFLLGMLTIAMSSVLWGGFGPWTPFQVFACGWVAAGAGLLPRASGRVELAMLAGVRDRGVLRLRAAHELLVLAVRGRLGHRRSPTRRAHRSARISHPSASTRS